MHTRDRGLNTELVREPNKAQVILGRRGVQNGFYVLKCRLFRNGVHLRICDGNTRATLAE